MYYEYRSSMKYISNNKVFICLEMKQKKEREKKDGVYRNMAWLIEWRWNKAKNRAWDKKKQ